VNLPVSFSVKSVRIRITLFQRLQEVWRFRELIFNLVIRELKARYKSSVLGFIWSLLNPLGMMLIFTIVFTILAPTAVVPKYPIYLLCGLLPWQFFANGVLTGTNSIVANAGLVKKVYFPREVLPIASVAGSLINFLLAMVVLFGLLAVFGARLSPWMWLLPILIVIEAFFILGVAFFLSALQVYYRDTLMVMEIVINAWFFMTPVFYVMDLLPRSYRILGITIDVHRAMYMVNPMASLIQSYRDLLYFGYRTNLDFFLRTAITSIAILALGYRFFVHFSRSFGEEV
jgi:lipopolysaccharide transport system permease protein